METLNYPLNDQQLHLLELFSKKLPDETWHDIRKIMAEYFAQKAMDAADESWDKNDWGKLSEADLSSFHFRTPYNSTNQ